MRITGGQVKGRRLASPKGLNIRPSSDQVREAIFNIIGQDLSGLRVLDLFAGTGSLGLEALSRGAHRAVFIDYSQKSINLIKQNLGLCGYQGSGVVLRRELRKARRRGPFPLKEKFDLVFLDPPYGKNLIPFLLEELSANEILSPRSRVVAESSKNERLPRLLGNLEMGDTRIYGDTRISIYACEVKK
jgi:16S rRNA (guanine966-N2)-methyltransferase